MNIRHRLNIANVVGSLAGVAVAIWIAFTALSSVDKTQDAVDRAFESLRYAVEFRKMMALASDNVQNIIRMDKVEEIPNYMAEHHRLSRIISYVKTELESNASSVALKSSIAELSAELKDWQRNANILFGMVESQSVPTAEVMARHDTKLTSLMEDVLRVTNLDATQASERIKDQLINSLSVAGAVGLAILCAALLIGLRTVAVVSRGLRSISSDMQRLAKGDMNIQDTHADRKDEIGTMAQSVRFFREALEERSTLEKQKAEESKIQGQLADQQTTLIDRLEQIVAAGVAGDFSASMDRDGLEGAQLQLADSVNTLLDAVGSGLAAISLVMSDLADANLSSRMEGDFKGSFASLRNDVNKTCETLATLIHKVQAMVHNIDEGTRSLSTNGRELTARSDEQSASISATVQTVDAMVVRVAESRDLSDGAVNRAGEAENRADHGQSVVSQSVAAIREIEKSSQKITDIISVIESIAFQTNLLALNAAVEAARAGESGKGFAVVATEVRTLAQRTTDAAHDISQLIRDSSTKVDQGVVLAEATGTALVEIKESIATMARDVRSISTESAQLSKEAMDVRAAMTNLETLSTQSAEIVGQSAETTRDFEHMTRELSSAVAQFRVEGTDPVVVQGGNGEDLADDALSA